MATATGGILSEREIVETGIRTAEAPKMTLVVIDRFDFLLLLLLLLPLYLLLPSLLVLLFRLCKFAVAQ